VVAIFRCESQHASTIGQSRAFAALDVHSPPHHPFSFIRDSNCVHFHDTLPFPRAFILSSVLSMTIAVLRALHAIIGSAIDDIERVYASGDRLNSEESTSRHTPENTATPTCTPDNETAIPEARQKTPQSNSQAYASPPPSPSMVKTSHSVPALPSSSWTQYTPDFPSLDAPFDPTSLSEVLTSHPDVLNAISRIVAAAGHMTATVQTPFLTLCDATMGVSSRMNVLFHIKIDFCSITFRRACVSWKPLTSLRYYVKQVQLALMFFRSPKRMAFHRVNWVSRIVHSLGLPPLTPLCTAHILRLLATHHILREISPDVFTLNRISSLVDSGKSFAELKRYQAEAKWVSFVFSSSRTLSS